jgi:hypothetical protein
VPLRRAGVKYLERETGFEPATSTLARSHSTTELLPLGSSDYKQANTSQQRWARLNSASSPRSLRTFSATSAS